MLSSLLFNKMAKVNCPLEIQLPSPSFSVLPRPFISTPHPQLTAGGISSSQHRLTPIRDNHCGRNCRGSCYGLARKQERERSSQEEEMSFYVSPQGSSYQAIAQKSRSALAPPESIWFLVKHYEWTALHTIIFAN